MIVNKGYIRVREPDGTFSELLPITISDLVDVGGGTSLTDKLISIDYALANIAPSQEIIDLVDVVGERVDTIETDLNTVTQQSNDIKTILDKLPVPATKGDPLPTSITGKAGSATVLDAQDTRSVVVGPFTNVGLSMHLKNNTADGLADGGTLHGVLNVSQWNDASGGNAHQLGFTANGNVHIRTYDGSAYTAWRPLGLLQNTANRDGFMDYLTTAPTGTKRLNYSGYLYATRVYNAVYNDYAEYFKKDDMELEPGDVVSINPDGDGYIGSRHAFDELVVGVYSDDYAQCIGGDGDGNDEDKYASVGMAGRVRVKVVGSVRKGQLLVSSVIPRVAAAVHPDDTLIPGTVIGKALEDHDGNDVNRIWALILNR